MGFDWWVFLQLETEFYRLKAVLEPNLWGSGFLNIAMDLDQDEALEAAQKRVKEDKEYVVDLERFFDRIHHD